MKKKILIVVACVLAIIGCLCRIFFNNKDINNSISTIQNVVQSEIENIDTYEMTKEEIDNLATTEIIEQSEEDEKQKETEAENFELQGNIAYNGAEEYPQINLGNYKALTYYSQIDARWRDKLYTATGNTTQTIGSSGCGPTSMAMVVTAIKGTITPPEMADLFVQYGFRSPNNGTYWSAYRWVADVFNIGYQETTNVQKALQLLESNYYVVCSVGNGLFTTGGHYIVLTKVENGVINIYDPYLYSGKFDTSTRRGKVTVSGNTVYCSVENFKQYANFKGAFAYQHNGNVQENTSVVTTSNYTRYVNTNSKNLNVRATANGRVIGSLKKGTAVTVAETNGSWSRIISPVMGWVSNSYLSSSYIVSTPVSSNKYTTGTYKVTGVSKNSVLCVRTGAGTKYSKKTYRQLSANARSQNRTNGNYYANGYKNNVVFTVSKISGDWGYTPSGWVCLNYCTKIK